MTRYPLPWTPRPRLRWGALPLAALLAALLHAGCGPSGPGPSSKPHVLLITVDSLRADRPGFAGGPVATPAMDRIAAGGAVFTQAYTTAPAALPATASILTGLYPNTHGAREDGITRIGDSVITLAGRLSKAGYTTAAFPAAMALHPKHGLDREFEVYAEAFETTPRLSLSSVIGVSGTVVTDRAIEWLAARQDRRPWFLWVNFFDPHFFHDPEPPFDETYRDDPYNAEVAMVDRDIGRLLAWLDDHAGGERTLIVLAGNHGEGLGEGGEQYYGLLLGEATLRVPLVIRPPDGLDSTRRIDSPVSLVDVAPTVLELSGEAIVSSDPFDGISLAGRIGGGPSAEAAGSAGADRPVYFETMSPNRLFGWAPLRGVRAGPLKYIEAPGTSWRALYDMAAGGEKTDLAAERPAEVERLAAETRRLGGEMRPRPAAPQGETAEVIAAMGFGVTPPAVEPELPMNNLDVGNAALQARRSLQRRMMRSALFMLNDVMGADSDNYVALLDLALVGIGIGQAPAAEKQLRTLQALFPDDGEIYHQLGHVELMSGRPDARERATRLFEVATILAPLNEEALYDSACAISSEAPERALDYLARAVHNGFRDFQHMARDPDMTPLKSSPRFREITGIDPATAPPAGGEVLAPGQGPASSATTTAGASEQAPE